jgi:Transposase DDE domain group 1
MAMNRAAVRSTLRSLDLHMFHYLGKIAHIDERAADGTVTEMLLVSSRSRKEVTAAFDGGRLTSNGGVMLLAMAERRLGLADNLARVFPDRRSDAGRAQPCRYVPRSHVRDLLRLRGRRRPRSSEVRRHSSWPAVAYRKRAGICVPTDAVAAGECSAPARRDPTDLHFGRCMDG